MESKEAQAVIVFETTLTNETLLGSKHSDKPEKPNEIPQPGKDPETMPAEEPGPDVWPRKEPEIQPGKEPLTVPPTAPPEIPKRPDASEQKFYKSLAPQSSRQTEEF